jgi:hypothetical protein
MFTDVSEEHGAASCSSSLRARMEQRMLRKLRSLVCPRPKGERNTSLRNFGKHTRLHCVICDKTSRLKFKISLADTLSYRYVVSHGGRCSYFANEVNKPTNQSIK